MISSICLGMFFSIKLFEVFLNIPDKYKKIFIPVYILLILSIILTSINFFIEYNIYLKYIFPFVLFCSISGAIYYFSVFIYWIVKNKLISEKQVKIIVIGFIIFGLDLILGRILPFITKEINFHGAYIGVGLTTFVFAYALATKFNKEHLDLIDLTNNLEQKVLDRTDELHQAKEAIELKEKQKTEAFINISHEIKTPLTLISNYLDKHIKVHGITKELEISQQNTNKLKRDMINVLDFEKLDKGMAFYDHSKIADFSNIVSLNLNMFYEIAKRKGIKLKGDIEENIYIKADPIALDRVVNNLVDNAIKYTENKGRIDVSLMADKNNLELIVKDTGVGISEESIKHIFKPYFQVSEKKSNLQGIGMGLNIVKKIIDEIKGDMKVESKLNEGTRFNITLPRYYLKEGDKIESINHKIQKSSDSIIPIEPKIENLQEDRPSIFIVEDNTQMLSYLQENLMDNFNVYYAVNGKKALETLKSVTLPDIIISDIMMDVMDGYEFYDELLKIDKYKSIPFIFLTAKSCEHEKLNGLKKGAVDFIPKPFNINELIAKVESLIRFRDALRDEKLDELSDHIYRLLSSSTKFKIVQNESVVQKNINQDSLFADHRVSRRQVEIISLMKNGYERKEIADKLCISISTVNTQIERLYKKINVNNKIDLLKIIG